ncbi:MAG: WecB/TagA/CpsF family glycosyltransferase [Beijerinckiaceae bacterium]
MPGAMTAEIPDQEDPLRKYVFGVAISDLSKEAALHFLQAQIAQNRHVKLAFCNAHTANIAWGNPDLRHCLRDFTVFADGLGVDIAAKVLHGSPFAANLNGTDFVPELVHSFDKPLRIAMIGGRPAIAEIAARRLAAFTPQHSFAPLLHGFGDAAEIASFMQQLESSPVDVLLVAMGNPRQERWIAQHIDKRHATLAIGVGALFDFMADAVPRAPAWLRDMRMEWLFRLAQEPKRLFGRYVLGNPLFLLRVAIVKLGLRRF